jgi:hypothetical protein
MRRTLVSLVGFAWDAVILLLDILGRADIIRGVLPLELEFIVTPSAVLVIFLIAVFLLFSRTELYRGFKSALKSWIEEKPTMLTLGAFLFVGLSVGGLSWMWVKYGPQDSLRLPPDRLSRLSDADLKAYTRDLSNQIRSTSNRLDKEFVDTNKKAFLAANKATSQSEKEDIERQRRQDHEEEYARYDDLFKRLYLESASSAEREIINRLGKVRVVGPATITLGPGGGVGAVSLPQRPPALLTGGLYGGTPLRDVSDYLDRLSSLL